MRSPVKMLLFSTVSLLAVAFLAYTLLTPGWRPVVVSIYDGPQLVVDKRVQDVGQVETDRKVRTEFLIYNKGGKHLRLYRVEASCGCTVADISRQIIAPGDFSRIRVVLDTSLKIGKVRKKLTLFSNDPQRATLPLFVIGEAIPAKTRGHEPIMLAARDRLTLFKGECATCHVQKGIGKTGQALFLADCAMCHGQNAEGHLPSGPSLLGGDPKSAAWAEQIHRVIAEGSPHSPQMPPFSKAKGGPLNADEVASLVTFLKFKNLQNSTGSTASSANPTEAPSEEAQDHAAFQDALQNPH